jgi:hypothetical protein
LAQETWDEKPKISALRDKRPQPFAVIGKCRRLGAHDRTPWQRVKMRLAQLPIIRAMRPVPPVSDPVSSAKSPVVFEVDFKFNHLIILHKLVF